MYIMRNKDMIQGLKMTHLATSYPVELALNGKEMQLAMDNTDTMNDSWSMMCASVYSRTGIQIEGNYEIDFITVSGCDKLFH